MIPTGDSFSPSKKRIVTGEYSTLAFGIDNITSNIFCGLRFSYEDIFGNKYYQDLPFTYNETKDENMNKQKQIIEIRDIQSPILVGPKVKSLEDSTRECIDYDVFSGKSY